MTGEFGHVLTVKCLFDFHEKQTTCIKIKILLKNKNSSKRVDTTWKPIRDGNWAVSSQKNFLFGHMFNLFFYFSPAGRVFLITILGKSLDILSSDFSSLNNLGQNIETANFEVIA